MATTTDRLESLSSSIQEAITSCKESKSRSGVVDKLGAMCSSIEAEIALLKKNEPRKYIKVRKNLGVIANAFNGMIEGLASHELARRDLKDAMDSVQQRFYPNLCASISQEAEARAEEQEAKPIILSQGQKRVKMLIARSADWHDALKAVRVELKERERKHVEEAAKRKPVVEKSEPVDAEAEQISRLADQRKNLPVTLKQEFQLIRMPIIPIFSQVALNSEATFKKLGLKHFMVQGYGVLQDQLLLAISKTTAAKHELEVDKFAESVVSLLNERGSVSYNIATDVTVQNPRNADITLFWLLPTPRMNVLSRMALSQNKSTTIRWGLPF